MREFSVLEFFKYYFSKIIFVILFIIVGLVGSYVYTYHVQVPLYKSQTSLLLANTNTTITQNDITLNKNLVSTYRQIVKSRLILNQVIKNLKLDTNYGSLNSQVEVSSINDTELINISVNDVDKNQAKLIADEIAKVFKDEIVKIYNIENVSIIDKALVSESPFNVNVVKQFIIGEGLGFLVSSFIILVLFYMDDSVKSEDDIEKVLNLSVLGSVPKYKRKKA